MKIAIGCDQFAYDLKMVVVKHLESQGHEVVDYGCKEGEEVMYPDMALVVSEAVAAKEFERAILICGTGIGMAIVANKVPGVRAACCHDVYSAQRARKSNDAHIMTMGSEIVGYALAKELVDVWMASEFAGGRSKPKVERMDIIDEKYRTK
ncbi:MAG: ribose 5-phosphate isomerase B [Erysipelotrichaceae bacterium]|nr:ribose 5-phosphate isomerase B [Erysipelotrichaceae bacterium]MDP3306467.1 ribose 5-phosphate isomerase B [Erysipelotrichaceae bacterium]